MIKQSDGGIKDMRTVTLEELLEAGCHFGHQVTRQNPKARDYIFDARDGIHIIDLAKTKEGLDEAAAFVRQLAKRPDATMIILGAKRQAQPVVKEQLEKAQNAEASGLYSVTNRWIGGILTNFSEVSKNFKKLKDLSEKLANKKAQSGYTKKEISLWEKERQKLQTFYGGIVDMKKLPDALFIIDTHLEDLAVREARDMGVTIIGITDTNADPTFINYPIPANDDAVGSVKLIVSHIADAWIEGAQAGKKLATNTETESVSEIQTDKKEEQNEKTVESGIVPSAETTATQIKKGEEKEVKATTKKKTVKKSTKTDAKL